MLIVRRAQMQVFMEKETKNFEDRMIEHLREFFPDRFEKECEPAMRDPIRYGVDQAEGHGITGERDVCKYIDLMAAFDRDFDLAEWAVTVHHQ